MRKEIALTLLLILMLFGHPGTSLGIARVSLRPGAFSVIQSGSAGSSNSEVPLLKIDQAVEREIRGGESHSYRVVLTAEQYFNVRVEQRGVDLAVNLYGPNGQQVGGTDWEDKGSAEHLWGLAATPGDYKVEVQLADKQAPAGSYRIHLGTVREWRDAPAQDRSRVTAHGLFWEAGKLRDQGTAEPMRAALKKYEEALPLWRAAGDRVGEANTLTEIGFTYSRMGQPGNTKEYYEQALALFRALGNRRDQVIALNNLGLLYSRQNEPRKGLEYLEQAVSLSRTVGNRFIEAAILNGIGTIYDLLFERRKALESFGKAVEVFQSVKNDRWEATALTNLGISYTNGGEYVKALDAHERALKLRRLVKDVRGEGYTLQHLASVYEKVGDAEQALEYHQQSLPLWRAIGDPYGIAVSLHGIGVTHLLLKNHQKAIENFTEAIPLARASKERFIEYSALSALGAIYRDLGKVPEAINYYRQSLELLRGAQDPLAEMQSFVSRGQLHHLQNEPQKAIENYRQGLQLTRQRGDAWLEVEMTYKMAALEQDLGNLEEARRWAEDAIKLIESYRSGISSQANRISYFARPQKTYELHIDLLMQLYRHRQDPSYLADAFRSSERSRARSLLDILTEAGADIRQGVVLELLERERALQKELNEKTEKHLRLVGGKQEAERSALAKEIESLTREYEQTLARIRQSSPRYAALTQPEPLNLKQIQSEVLDPETLLLEYSLGEKRSYVWAVTTDTINGYELPGRAEIETLARRMYDLLTARNQRVKFETPEQKQARAANADADYFDAATSLSRMLLAPAAAAGKKRLLIVADGALQYLPFAALPLPESAGRKPRVTEAAPLITRYEVVTLPSASTLAVLRREIAGRKPAPKGVAVLADPVFAMDDQRVRDTITRSSNLRSLPGRPAERSSGRGDIIPRGELQRSARQMSTAEEGLRFPRLPFTRKEAESIIGVAPAARNKMSVDFDANQATATDPGMSQYRYLHFATHGLLNSKNPALSGLVLSLVDQGGEEQDGFLLAQEIYNLKLPAELVVLSGCRTGLGKEVRGEGLLTLTRGFMYAGAARVIVSLWDVGDESTAELMGRLYKKMLGKERLSPSAALRAAQVSMWKETKWRSPYHWAAFVLQGEIR